MAQCRVLAEHPSVTTIFVVAVDFLEQRFKMVEIEVTICRPARLRIRIPSRMLT